MRHFSFHTETPDEPVNGVSDLRVGWSGGDVFDDPNFMLEVADEITRLHFRDEIRGFADGGWPSQSFIRKAEALVESCLSEDDGMPGNRGRVWVRAAFLEEVVLVRQLQGKMKNWVKPYQET